MDLNKDVAFAVGQTGGHLPVVLSDHALAGCTWVEGMLWALRVKGARPGSRWFRQETTQKRRKRGLGGSRGQRGGAQLWLAPRERGASHGTLGFSASTSARVDGAAFPEMRKLRRGGGLVWGWRGSPVQVIHDKSEILAMLGPAGGTSQECTRE